MQDVDKDKIIDKIKKLMSLGMKDPESEEAKSAMAKVKDLLKKYDLETVDMNEDGSLDDSNILRVDIEFGNKDKDWESSLMMIVAKSFQCRYVRTGMFRGGIPTHVVIGSKTDVDFVQFLFKFVRLQIMKMVGKYDYNLQDRKTYCYGCVLSVETNIGLLFKKEKPANAHEQNQFALVVVKSKAVDKKTSEIFPNLSKGRKVAPLRGSATSYKQGVSDGNSIKLNRQVGGASAGMVN
jgi:hypothetical protein